MAPESTRLYALIPRSFDVPHRNCVHFLLRYVLARLADAAVQICRLAGDLKLRFKPFGHSQLFRLNSVNVIVMLIQTLALLR